MRSRQAKPAKPVHQALRLVWVLWLITVAIVYPSAVAIFAGVSVWAGIGVQLLGLIPALLCTPSVWRGRSAYALLWVSIVAVIYLGVAWVMVLLRYYEQAPTMVWMVQATEALLLLVINCQLFILLKRLPPMHKTKKQITSAIDG